MKRPLDGQISPAGEPEPTEAEFRADFAQLKKVLEPIYGDGAPEPEFDDADPLASLRRAEWIEKFVRRHRRRLDAMRMPTQEFLDEAARLRAVMLEQHAKVEKATEHVLQTQANVADLLPEAVEALLSIAAEIKGNLPTASAAAREHWEPVLKQVEENREQWLSDLPLEDRRRLEAKYPG
jgi:hypothetical protein